MIQVFLYRKIFGYSEKCYYSNEYEIHESLMKLGEGYMRCGSKCFLVTIEMNGEKQIKPVTARSPVDARKTIRMEYGAEAQILSVTKEEKKR